MGILDAPARPLPIGWNVARFITKMQGGSSVKVTILGDSVLQGSTATIPGTDDAASIFCTTLASRFGVTVTKDNQAQGGRTSAWETIEKWPAALTANADLYVLAITGKNDIAYEAAAGTATGLTGYRTADSLAQVESWIRQLRVDKPNADIMLVSGNPYSIAYGDTTGSNLYQGRYSNGLASLAAAYGCAYADGWNATPRAAGATNAADTTYLVADGVHPNSAGHAKIAAAMLANVPAALTVGGVPASALVAAAAPGTAVRPIRRSRAGIIQLANASATARTDRLVTPAATGSWTAGNTGPWTSTTVGARAEFIAKCSEVFLRFTYGTGQGVVDIIVDGQPYQAGVDLSAVSTAGSGKWLAMSGLTPGVHNVSLNVASGSVTLEAVAYAAAACQWVDIRDPKVTSTNLGAANDINQFYATHSNASTSTMTVAFDFVGTGLSMQMYRGSTGGGFYWASGGFVIDGTALSNPVVPTPFSGYGSMDLIKGLAYGRHSVSMSFGAAGLYVGGFSVLDEQPELHPTTCAGINKVGDTVAFPYPWTGGIPDVTVTSTTANAAGASSVTSSSFTITGTAGDLVRWTATCGQRGVY